MDVPPTGVAINLKSRFGLRLLLSIVVTWTVCVAWPAANVTVPEAAT